MSEPVSALVIFVMFINGLTIGISIVNLLWLNQIDQDIDRMRKNLQ